MAVIPDIEAIHLIREQKYEDNAWSNMQKTFLNRPRRRNPYLIEHEVSFTTALKILLKNSIFGIFLKCFNEQQSQDKYWNKLKLTIFDWDIDQQNELKEIAKFKGIEDIFSMLREAVENCDVIDMDFLYKKVEALRLTSFKINAVDKLPKKFKNLEILVLCGNWISDICGVNLPRKLKFLELFANEIDKLDNFVNGAPEGLLYIGLGRNKLTDDTNFCQLSSMKNLKCLDLSDNDIYDLLAVVKPLRELPQLCSLQLEGNPCSVSEAYKDVILKYLPKLLFLDNTEITDEDILIVGNPEDVLNKAALIFTCHRIVGLPPPPIEKGLQQTIHIEVSLPLLEEIIIEPEIVEEESIESEHLKEKSKGKKDKPKKDKGKKKGKQGKKGPPSLYTFPDEFADEIERKVKNTAFKTNRVFWSKIIEFPEEEIVVEHPENDFKAIRDTFRSKINVKVVYLKIEPPGMKKDSKMKKGKKSKSKQKGKKDKKKDKKKGKKKSKSATSSQVDDEKQDEKETEEVILKKVTLANFFCELHNLNWSDKTIDFYWADHPKANPNAISVNGSLRSVRYTGTKSDTQLSLVSSSTLKDKKEPLPNIFTCQVGFGLRRGQN